MSIADSQRQYGLQVTLQNLAALQGVQVPNLAPPPPPSSRLPIQTKRLVSVLTTWHIHDSVHDRAMTKQYL